MLAVRPEMWFFRTVYAFKRLVVTSFVDNDLEHRKCAVILIKIATMVFTPMSSMMIRRIWMTHRPIWSSAERVRRAMNSPNILIDSFILDVNPSNHQVIHRALSTVSANQTLVHNQRNLLAKNFRRISVNDDIVTIDHNDADASFLLPNLYDLPDEIRVRVIDSLVDTPTMTTLEETSVFTRQFFSSARVSRCCL